MDTDIRALSGIRTHDPSGRASDHADQLIYTLQPHKMKSLDSNLFSSPFMCRSEAELMQ
jgi:hypothetical protein